MARNVDIGKPVKETVNVDIVGAGAVVVALKEQVKDSLEEMLEELKRTRRAGELIVDEEVESGD